MARRKSKLSLDDRRITAFDHACHRHSARYNKSLTYDELHRLSLAARRQGQDWVFIEAGEFNCDVGLARIDGKWCPIVYDRTNDLIRTILPEYDVRVLGWDLKTGKRTGNSVQIDDPRHTPEFIVDWVQGMVTEESIWSGHIYAPREDKRHWELRSSVSSRSEFRRFGICYYLYTSTRMMFRVDANVRNGESGRIKDRHLDLDILLRAETPVLVA